MKWGVRVGLLVMALAVAAPVHAAPPANDNRAAAEVIPSFGAPVAGTTVEATVERLDPQVSQCGRVESTVWYRLVQAPDGTIVVGVSGAGFAPVLRVYELRQSSIRELDCGTAAAGRRAQVAFEAQRGSSYLVLVGKRPGTADAAFTLDPRLFLPPANDSQRQARGLGRLPANVKGSTFGATADDADPEACGLVGGTVWYSLVPGAATRVAISVHAAGDFDASVVLLRRIRSERAPVGCAATDRRGNATVVADVEPGARYLVVVGRRQGSAPGDFTLRVVAAQPAERAPGRRLPRAGGGSVLNGLTNVNDVWWTTFVPGTTYRIAFRSTGCARLALRARGKLLRTVPCGGYSTFTPGPDGGGQYVFEVVAPAGTGSSSYRLQVAAAAPDDVGVGIALANRATVRGALAPSGLDVVDVYHFDVARPSDVQLRLRTPGSLSMVLVTDAGARMGTSDRLIRGRLARGRYIVAVRGTVGRPRTAYTLSLLVRELTRTTLTASATEVLPGATLTLTPTVTPAPGAGRLELQIDRFDPLAGWQFHRLVTVPATQASVSWTPPALGRWRVRATFLGTVGHSPSRSAYVHVLVATPLPPAP